MPTQEWDDERCVQLVDRILLTEELPIWDGPRRLQRKVYEIIRAAVAEARREQRDVILRVVKPFVALPGGINERGRAEAIYAAILAQGERDE